MADMKNSDGAGGTVKLNTTRDADAKAAKTAAEDTAAAKATNDGKGKSIVDPKYRERMKGREPDWVAKRITEHSTATKTVTRSKTEGEGEAAKKVNYDETVNVGVDIDKLEALAKMNKLPVDGLLKTKANHGFGGRFKMTVSNLLRAAVKQRHGMFIPDTKGIPVWLSAPKDFLTEKGAPDKPTHNQDGTKIAVPKPEKPAKEAPAADAKTETAKA